jgi:hypothetical protein
MLAAITVSGCTMGGPVPLPSCTVPSGTSVSNGMLRMLPSEVPGVSIDTAVWGSADDVYEGGTGVYYFARVSSTVTMPLRRFALQFHSNRPEEDSSLIVRGPSMNFHPTSYSGGTRGGTDSIRPGEYRTARASLRRHGPGPGPWGCPRTAQVVRELTPLVRIAVLQADSAAPRNRAFTALVQARLERLGDTTELRVVPRRDVEGTLARDGRRPVTTAEWRELAARLDADVVVSVVPLQREPQPTARAVAHFRAFAEADSIFVARGITDEEVANRLTQRLLDETVERLRQRLLETSAREMRIP